MARVFMSFLGTNPYTEVCYNLRGDLSSPTPFVQEALISLLCREWRDKDRFVFFLTQEARQKNWEDGGNFSEGLKTRIKKLGLKPKIVEIPFHEGRSEEEIMKNFLQVVTSLEEGDKVIFDITHSFRSLPMLNLVALNYARVLKKVSIQGIYYGAFETLGSSQEAKKIPLEKRIAPIFDLTSYALLLDWSFAVEEFVRYGLADRLFDLVQGEVRPILKETRGQDKRAKALRDIAQGLKNLALNIYTCRCQAIENTRLSPTFFAENALDDFLPPFAPLMGSIKRKVEPFFTETPWEKAMAAVGWCVEHKLVQQGYTILQEAATTEICRLAGLNPLEKKDRDFVSKLLNVTAKETPPEEWFGELRKRQEKALAIQKAWGEPLKELSKAFASLTEVRNDINHCGCRKDKKDAQKLHEEFKEHYQRMCKAIKDLQNMVSLEKDNG